MTETRGVGIVGGCGHVGLPLGLALARVGHHVTLFDQNSEAVDMVAAGKMPFLERGAVEALADLTGSPRLRVTTDPGALASVEHVIVVIGTPLDSHLMPEPQTIPDAIVDLLPHLRDGQHVILRSTVFPGVTAMVERVLAEDGLRVDVSFCPERIAEGDALHELTSLPQIISSRSEAGLQKSAELFGTLAPTIVTLDVEEAELAKLFTNTWRYIRFAAANQLYMIANDLGLDFERIREALATDYPRAADLPRAGLTAGPCLLKDTMQLAATNVGNFTLGHASMMVNEGLPLYLVSRMQQRFELTELTVGILGMAFKAETDDIRSSLSYKLRRLLHYRTKRVLCTDPYVRDDDLLPLDHVVEHADVLVVAAPHARYAEISTSKPVIDVWNVLGRGVRV
jgi:UDP-N-acetyl-D-mannosaminuronic acid dehydrogenase